MEGSGEAAVRGDWMGDGGVGVIVVWVASRKRNKGMEGVLVLVLVLEGLCMRLLGFGFGRGGKEIDSSLSRPFAALDVSLPVSALPCFPHAPCPAPHEYPDAQTDQGGDGGAHADDEACGHGLVQG